MANRRQRALLGDRSALSYESKDEDGLVVVDIHGNVATGAVCGYADAIAAWQELKRDAAGLPKADRRRYYDQLCESTARLYAVALGRAPFADQLGRHPACACSAGQ